MAKCSICKAVKAKRYCQVEVTSICPRCCAKTRNLEKCGDCTYYVDPISKRKYTDIPFIPVVDMSNSPSAQNVAQIVESCLIELSQKSNIEFLDSDANDILKLFFNEYYFKDKQLIYSSQEQSQNYKSFIKTLYKLFTHNPDFVIKVCATVQRSIKRHTNGKNEYLRFIESMPTVFDLS